MRQILRVVVKKNGKKSVRFFPKIDVKLKLGIISDKQIEAQIKNYEEQERVIAYPDDYFPGF